MTFRRIVSLLLVLALSIGFLPASAFAAEKPDAPVMAASNILSSGKIRLTWDAVEGASIYRIYRSATRTGGYTRIKSTSSTAYTDSSADVGDTFYYLVKAVSDSGSTSASSNKVSATAKLPRTTVTLSNVTSTGKIKVSWTAVEGAEGYEVYRATSKNGTYKRIKTTTATSMTNASTTAGKMYYYKVLALAADPAANSALSSARARTCKLAQPVIKVSAVTATGKNKISWSAIDGAESYDLYRSTDKSTWTKIQSTTETRLIDNEAVAGTKYYYRLRAISSNSSANSAYSSGKSRTTDLAQPVLTLTNEASGRVTIRWEAIDDAVEYKVYRAESEGGTYTRVKVTEETAYTDTTAAAGQTYYYKVIAVAANTGGNSAYSEVVSGVFTYPEGLNLSISLNEDGRPYLTWNEVEGATGYRVYRSYQETAGFKLLSTRTATYYTNPSAPEGVALYYQLRAVDADGNVLETSETVPVLLELSEEETLLTRYVCVPSVNLYTAPDSSSTALPLRYMEALRLGQAVITSTASAWYRVFYQDDLYYLWMETGEEKLTDTASSFSYTGNTEVQQAVLDLAMEIHNDWNTIYATGQSNGVANSDGTYGFNAPGLVKYIFNTVMQQEVPFYSLSQVLDTLYATTELYNAGYPGELTVTDIAMEDIQPGDVLFFGTSEVSYCGIYLGSGEFLYSTSSWEDGVCIMPLNSFLKNLLAIRRYLPESVTAANTTEYIVGDYKTYKLYSEKNSSSTVLKTLALYDAVTVLYTDSGSWAYVRAEDGTEGYFLVKYFGEYEYLDYVTLSASLNDEGKPYLTWNKVKDAESYEVYRSMTETGGYELLSTSTNTYYTNASAPEGIQLYYQVKALAADGTEIDVSDPVSVTTELAAEETLLTKYVFVPVVNLYELPDANSEPLSLRYMEELQLGTSVIVREDGTWYRVFYSDQLYYLWSANIDESLTSQKSSFIYTGNTDYQQQVIDLALEISQEWNTIYAHEQSNGIANPDGTYGFDCSGLVAYIFNRVMQSVVPTYRLYSALETQYATTGIYNAGYPGAFSASDVAPDDLQPGDILFFTSLADGTASTEIGHCGIYMGNNEFIHSTSSWSDAVCIMRLAGSYLENYVGARRYLPETVTSADTVKSIVGPYYSYNLYSEQNSESAVLATLAQYDPVTILFTDNETWAYVRTEDGTEGFFLMEHLGEYEYLDYVTLSAELNADGKPYLSWNKVQGAESYEIYRSLEETTGYSLISTTENTYYTNTTVPEGIQLYYQVTALDADGNAIDTSDAVSVTIGLSGEETLLTSYVNVLSVKLYALPDTASDSITLRYMEEVQLGSVVTSSWHRVFHNDTLYYLWMESGDGKLTNGKSSFTYTGNTELQQEVLDLASEIANDWNTIYATGQSDGVANEDGTYGFNSPGLVKYVFNTVMQEKVPFYALSQVLDALYATGEMYNAGYPGEFAVSDVAEADLQPGDVLFFGSGTTVSYCGIYLGNGEFVYSSSSWADGVCIMPLSGFRDSLVKIRRYLPDSVIPADTVGTISGSYKNYKVYAEKSASSTVIATPALGDSVTLLFTDNGSWGYVRTADGIEGYLLLKYFT